MSRDRIAVFAGRSDSFNFRCTTLNVGRILAGSFDLDVITTTPESYGSELRDHYDVYGGDYPSTLSGEVGALKSYFESNDPAVVTQLGRVPLHGNILLRYTSASTKIVCRFAGANFWEYKVVPFPRKVLTFGFRNVAGRLPMYFADRFITMGPRMKRELINRGVDAEDIDILPPPINPSRIQSSDVDLPFDVPDDRYVAMFLGRVSRLKGIRTIETAIPQILDRREDIQFVLVGEQEVSLDIDAEYEDHVTVPGPVEPSAVPACLDAADVLMHPSLTEGMSRAVLEALVSGTPVVARDVGDLAFATNNIFVSNDDFVDIVCDFESLAVDDPTKFTIDAQRTKYIRCFESVL